jgi:DmsE family decaheme c-type cytochrome
VFLLLTLSVLHWPIFLRAQPGLAAENPLPVGYAGAETCRGCHADQFVRFERTRHGRLFFGHARNMLESLACENCHGPGKAHADSGGTTGARGLISFARNDKTAVERRNATCLACHTKGARLLWKGSAHEARDVACTSCHTLMEDVSPQNQLTKVTEMETCGACHAQARAQQMRSSHMPVREGKMTCSSCHNAHGTITQTLLKTNGLNESCYKCHPEKRGPFLWRHPPVQESCANCHDPHGSNHESMLKVALPRLCQQCHLPGGHPARPFGRDAPSGKFVMGRSCVDCHQLVHGSNHPSGSLLSR